MPDVIAQVEIPNRALFKASEVCELVQVQPYVLRSWEAEFPDLGLSKTSGGPRVYRRADVEQVVRIKHLLLVEGLTLAGARRRIEEEMAPVAADEPAIDEWLGRNARERLTEVKRGLRSILEMLGAPAGAANGGVGRAVSAPVRAVRVGPPRSKAAARPKTTVRTKSSRPSASAARRKRS